MRILLALALLLFGVGGAHAQVPMTGAGKAKPSAAASSVTLDAVGTKQKSSTGLTSYNYTGMTVGSGNALIVTVSYGGVNAGSLTAVWDSGATNQSMTLLASLNHSFSIGTTAIFGLRSPTSGNKTLALTWTGSNQVFVDGISFSGVNVTSDATAFPVAGRTTLEPSPTASPSITVTSATGHMAVAVTTDQGNNYSAPTQTSLYIDNTGSAVNSAAAYASGAASVSFGWTSSSGTDRSAMAGVDVSP